MSHINGKGFGSSHDWREVNGGNGYSQYSCKDCGQSFTHLYRETPQIFTAIKAAGVPEICSKKELVINS